MTVKTMKEAWKVADEIMPTDYEYDTRSSSTAGYGVYRSTVEGHYYDYICDLGDRLEINLSDGRTINVWVDSYHDEVDQMVEENHAAKEYGRHMAMELYESGTYKRMVFAVDGSAWNTNETEKTLYNALGKPMAKFTASDMIAEYCKAHQIPWFSITGVEVRHIEHGNGNDGHYIIEAYVGLV